MLHKRGLVLLVLAGCALLSILHWWRMGRPVVVVDAPGDRLNCVSYAPFHKPRQSPEDKSTYIAKDQIEADIKQLAQRFGCVRIYSVSQGLHEVPRLAEKHGIKVLLGMRIGRSAAENEKELTRAVDLAKNNPQSVQAIIVGNEVLLRAEQPVPAMRAYIERVKAAVPGVPVTYADVAGIWLRNKELAEAVDYVTLHILPYWEDPPLSIENAVGHVSHAYRQVKGEFKGKGVMIGETGWPSYGRQRQGAEPSLVNQARFIREFAVRAGLEKIPYNVIEAFDQPWKRKPEGAAGGYWGLYDRDGNPKFPFRGPVAEAPGWSFAAYGAMAAFFAVFMREWQRLGRNEILTLLAVSICGGGACADAWRDMLMASRTAAEWTVTGLYTAVLAAAALLLGRALASWCAEGKPLPDLAPASHLVRWARRNDQSFDGAARLLGALRIAVLFGAALVCLLLAFDPRYRDFPLALYSLPAAGFALTAWIKGKSTADIEEMLLAVWIGFAGLWIAAKEHITITPHAPWRLADEINPHALAWTALCLLLAGSVLAPEFVELRARQRQNPQ